VSRPATRWSSWAGPEAPPNKGTTPVLVRADGRLASLEPGSDHRIGKPQADICLVFDTTGSMSDKIEGLVVTMSRLVGDLDSLGLDWRVTTVPFGDLTVRGDRIEEGFGFVDDCTAARSQLRSMPRFSGGGNAGESSIEAMMVALNRPWRTKAVKVLVLLTDEPALGPYRARTQMVEGALRSADAVCFVASPDLPYFRSWAAGNGGRWVPIGPTMDTRPLLAVLDGLLRDVASVAHEVHQLAAGSVSRYRELTKPGSPGA
jgi:hypothetical protein